MSRMANSQSNSIVSLLLILYKAITCTQGADQQDDAKSSKIRTECPTCEFPQQSSLDLHSVNELDQCVTFRLVVDRGRSSNAVSYSHLILRPRNG